MLMNFGDAKKYCASLNSHLIEFSTQAQMDFLKQKVTEIYSTVWTTLDTDYIWWLGLEFRSGKWYWIHSNTICSFGQCLGSDGASSEHWMTLKSNGVNMDDEKASNMNYPICQI